MRNTKSGGRASLRAPLTEDQWDSLTPMGRYSSRQQGDKFAPRSFSSTRTNRFSTKDRPSPSSGPFTLHIAKKFG